MPALSPIPKYQLLPPLPPADDEALEADIAERGVMVAVEVDENGEILDGHHRHRIAQALGIDCPTVTRPGMSEAQKQLHVLALNLYRRHLSDAQKVLIGMAVEDNVAKEARQRQLSSLRQNADGRPGQLSGTGETRDEVAERVRLGSGRTYARGKRVIEKARDLAPDLLERVESGDSTVTLRDLNKQVRQAEKARRVAEIARSMPPDLTTLGSFGVLYADPPWRYEPGSTTPDRVVENHYPTMALEDICGLKVPADDNAVLFLWATSPKLAEAMEVVAAWGFTYKTCLVWVKDRVGTGSYARQRHELLLVATRGAPGTPVEARDSVIEARRREHSVKPDVVYEVIEGMYPHLPRVELFARRPRHGWAAWGNQA